MTSKEKLLSLICRPGGVDIYEALGITGLDYVTIVQCLRELERDGINVVSMQTGRGLNPRKPWVKNMFLSNYDPRYNELMGEYENESI